ncbi:MAG: DUF1918 domain-containing protein [Jatrophihabitantaceae bacterium]
MFARVGDWLVVESRNEGRAARRGEIVGVARADGAPPYRVRWDADHEALVFPGPDARVLTADELATHDRAHAG